MSRSPSSRRSAFTLVEIMVVLSIAALVTAITVGGFRSLGESNRRISCQSNLAQIYQACRVYAQDYSGKFPYSYSGTPSVTGAAPGGIGLWALYTYPDDTDRNGNGRNDDLPLFRLNDTPVNKPLSSYVRSTKLFHCPADYYQRDVNDSGTTAKADAQQLYLDRVADPRHLNPQYLSYQVDDEGTSTYSTFRGASEKRQLLYYTSAGVFPARAPSDKTIVTWCRFHRRLSQDGLTTTAGARNFDNVLFYDGTVQLVARNQDVGEAPPSSNTGTCNSWQRVPKDLALKLVTPVANCNPG